MTSSDKPRPRKFDESEEDPGIKAWREDLSKRHGVQFFSLDPRSIEMTGSLGRWLTKKTGQSKPTEPQRESQAAPGKAQAGQREIPAVRWRTWIGRGVRVVAFATGLVILVLGAWLLARWGLDELSASATVTRNSSLCGAMPGFGPEMIVLEGGEFDMGDESTGSVKQLPRRVTVKPFAVGTCEVTFEEYDRFAEATKRSLPDDEGWGGGRRPVINVSWDDAKAYAGWLSQQTGKSYRLPTEAEWEYAARSGGRDEIWAGTSDERKLQDYAVFGRIYDKGTELVGSKKPNGLGLYDMNGNVAELVEDCAYEPEKYVGCGLRVVRGGSWPDTPEFLRRSKSNEIPHKYGFAYVGFRLVQRLEP